MRGSVQPPPRPTTAFESYLRRAIVNLHTSGLRRRRLERAWLQREGHRVATATSMPVDVGARPTCGARSRPCRRANVPRWCSAIYEDLSERDTAEALGCTLAAVKSLVARGSEALRTQLPTYASEGDE